MQSVDRRIQGKRLIIFGRYPQPGCVKTRMIGKLGPLGAAELQRRLMERTVAVGKSLRRHCGTEIVVCYSGGSPSQVRRWLGRDLLLESQSPGELGARMQNAFQKAFSAGARQVVLIGTDIPGLQSTHLQQAFGALQQYDVVLGPSQDGGYYLIGMKRRHDLFDGLAWGSSGVLAETLRRARKAGCSVFLLPVLLDLDRPEDLHAWQGADQPVLPYLSVIIPARNEEQHLLQCIQSARHPGVEILVVDGGSRDRTLELARAAGVRTLPGLPGRARQQNLGARRALGERFLFLHADTCLPPGYADLLFEVFMDSRMALAAFRFQTDLAHAGMRLIEYVANLRSRLLGLPYGDQGFAVRRRLFEDLGGFPETPLAEDLLFVRRAARKGRIRILRAGVRTSARRWQRLGLLRATAINQFILLGLALGVAPATLSRLYAGRSLLKSGRQ